jgi:hypothetical protein
MRAWMTIALVVCTSFAGCATYRITPMRFRTMQPDDAFPRALTSMETHTGAIRTKDRKRGTIRSRWIEGSVMGGLFYQYVVGVLPNAADGSASVTVKLRVVRCNLVTKFSEDKARWCDPDVAPTKTEVVAFDRFRASFRADVFRHQEAPVAAGR